MSPAFFFCLCFIQLLIILEATTTSNGGLSIDLIHRDSPKSPFYNPLNTDFDRLRNAIRRSNFRSSHFNKIYSGKTKSQIILSDGEYLMKFSIGTPPVEVLNIVDTGSDILWLQCKPCTHCFKQKTPFFNPKKSSTYQNLPCQSKQCLKAGVSGVSVGCNNSTTCQYLLSYADLSYSKGYLALEKFTFNSDSSKPVSFPKVMFGCGHNNNNTNIASIGSGITGLGTAPISLIKQITSFSGKFSYCLVPPDSGKTKISKINFGSNAVVSGPGVVSTPYITIKPHNFYFLTLESITIGKNNLPNYKNSKFGSGVQKGNILIDSGATLTYLPEYLYQGLESALVKAIKGTRVNDTTGEYNLCYSTALDESDVPTITAHFSGGANLELLKSGTFLAAQEGILCLSMVPTKDDAIFGNLAQRGFLVGFDTVKKVVSFKPKYCG